MSLSAYLAKNYLTASPSPSSDPSGRPKKRRRKDAVSATGLIIADDDVPFAGADSSRQHDDEETPMYDAQHRSAEFRRSKSNNWKTIGAPAPAQAEQVEADAILAAAALESDQKRQDDEDAPAVIDEVPKMESGAHAGLQTAADTEAMVRAAERRRAAELKAPKNTRSRTAEEETVYRDATGRRIDVSMKRAEARAVEQEKLRKELREKEDAMGEVQKQQKEQRKQELDQAKFMGVARHADDEEMNEELKGQVRWDDPMAAYMVQNEVEEGGRVRNKSRSNGTGLQLPKKNVYQGAAPPNRYGILPGWRWDGVDRGNGFEKEWFQARGRKSRHENLEYQWQMDE